MDYYLKRGDKALISVAVDEDFVAGVMNAQALLHFEGLYVDPDYRGMVDFRRLVKTITDDLPKGMNYYAFAPNSKIATICRYVHMKPTGWKVFRGST